MGRLWQWHRQLCWGVGRGNSLTASFNTVLLLSSLEWVTVYISSRFEELQVSVIMMQSIDNQRNVCQSLSCVGESRDIGLCKGWLALQRKSAQICPYLSTRILRRNFIPEEVPEIMFLGLLSIKNTPSIIKREMTNQDGLVSHYPCSSENILIFGC